MSGAEQLQVLCHSLMFGRLVEMESIVRQTSYKVRYQGNKIWFRAN